MTTANNTIVNRNKQTTTARVPHAWSSTMVKPRFSEACPWLAGVAGVPARAWSPWKLERRSPGWTEHSQRTASQKRGPGSASLPPGSLPGPTTHWRACRRCGCFEPFAGLTEECCANTLGLACSFVEGSIEDEDGHSYLQRVVIDEHLAQLQGHHERAFPLCCRGSSRPTTAPTRGWTVEVDG